MDYEQKYKEAFARAKTLHKMAADTGYDNTRMALEHIFPQLRESGDERIRKALIEALKTSKTVGELKFILPEPTREECIAYLEKQKEQKHPNGCFTCDEYKKGYEAGRSNGFTAGYNKAMKEQKPVKKEITLTNFEEVLNTFLFDFANSPIEDCEPKEYTKKHSAEILKAAYTELNAQLKQDIFEAQQEGRREGYEAAKAEQKPEWSAEDDAYRIEAVKLLENPSLYESCPNLRQETIEWLKRLPQVSVKQEWSEEDELMRKRCIVDLGYLTEYEPQYKERYDAQINWLESLRPKPKQEWGEEDKTNGWTGVDSERYISCLQRLGTGNPQQPETINSKWFKEHCQPQPKQEWSEEDERMLSRCIKSKDLLSKHRKECIKGIRYDKRRSDD